MKWFSESSDWRQMAVAIAVMLFLQSSVILLIALAVARLSRSKGAAVRSAILRAALVAMIVCPLVSGVVRVGGLRGLQLIPAVAAQLPGPTPVVPAIQSPIPISRQMSEAPKAVDFEIQKSTRSEKKSSELLPQPVLLPTPSAFVSAAVERPPHHSLRLADLLVGLWFIVTAALLLRLIIANALIAITRRRATPAGADLQHQSQSIANELGVRPPTILIAWGITGPCLVGWKRPAILQPDDSAEIDREILIHELAHLARRDCAWHLLTRISVALLWFQPLIWIWARAVEQSAEEACDDAVLAHHGNRAAYATRLADLAERVQQRWATAGAGVGVVGMQSTVGRRIARLLNATTLSPRQLGRRGRMAVALGTMVIALGLGALRSAAQAQTHPAESTPQSSVAGAESVWSGRVFSFDGASVGGAHVSAVDRSDAVEVAVASTQADENGNFALRIKSPTEGKSIELQAFSPGRGIGMGWRNGASSVDIHLQPTTRIKLTLVDFDGKPIAGLKVYPRAFISRNSGSPTLGYVGSALFMRMPPVLCQAMSATTADDGTVTLNDLPRHARFELAFDDDHFALPGVDKRVLLSDDDPTSLPVVVKLEPAGTITGAVRFGPTSKPAAGIAIFAQPTSRSRFGSGWGRAVTDDNGFYKLAQLPGGEYNIVATLNKAVRVDWTAVAHDSLAVKAGEKRTDVDFTLIKGSVITGKVTMDDTGKPIVKTQVGVYGPAYPRSGAMVQGAVTDDAGIYTLRVPPGAQNVYVMGFLPEVYRGDRQNIIPITVKEGETFKLDFKMRRRPGNPVSGVVTGVDGKPAVGITVRAAITKNSPDPYRFTKTDAQGKFHFDALLLDTPVSVHDENFASTETITVIDDTEIHLKLVRRVKLALPGLVTDEVGKPIAGAQIHVSESFGSFGLSSSEPIISDAAGRYVLKDLYTDGSYQLLADAETQGFGSGYATPKLAENMLELPTIKLPRANTACSGIVVDSKGKPVGGVTVFMNAGASIPTRVTDNDGHFSFPAVPGIRRLIYVRTQSGDIGPSVNALAGEGDLKLELQKGDR